MSGDSRGECVCQVWNGGWTGRLAQRHSVSHSAVQRQPTRPPETEATAELLQLLVILLILSSPDQSLIMLVIRIDGDTDMILMRSDEPPTMKY